MEEMTYNEQEICTFMKGVKNTKLECAYKMIFAYKISRFEVLALEWNDVDFEKNTITISVIRYQDNGKSCKNYWNLVKDYSFSRTYPLLRSIKKLLLKEKEKQETNKRNNRNYNTQNESYIFVDNKGKRINANTLSRNMTYVARDNGLPIILISGLKNSMLEYFFEQAKSPDFYRAWTRFDLLERKENVYSKLKLNKNKDFNKAINEIVDKGKIMTFEDEM